MESTLTTVNNGEGLFNVPTSLYDSDINNIATFQTLAVNEDTGEAGCIIRIVELQCFRYMIEDIRAFNSFTGYNFTPAEIKIGEADILLSQLKKIRDVVQHKNNEASAGVSHFKKRMELIKTGRVEGLSSDGLKNELLNCTSQVQYKEKMKARTEEYLAAIQILESILNVLTEPHSELNMKTFSSLYRIPNMSVLASKFNEVKYAIDRMSTLQKSFRAINTCIAMENAPSNKFSRSRSSKRDYAFTYYHASASDIRNIMTLSDYRRFREHADMATERHIQAVSADINLSGI